MRSRSAIHGFLGMPPLWLKNHEFYKCLSLKMSSISRVPILFSSITKSSAPQRLCARSQWLCQLTSRPPARRIFRAGAPGRRVNTFIKRHLPLKSSFIAKNSAPLRLCAGSQCLRQLTALPSTTYCSRRGAGAQSEQIHQETSSPKNALPLQKALRLSASARDYSAYAS
jgi:hypothetical protein